MSHYHRQNYIPPRRSRKSKITRMVFLAILAGLFLVKFMSGDMGGIH